MEELEMTLLEAEDKMDKAISYHLAGIIKVISSVIVQSFTPVKKFPFNLNIVFLKSLLYINVFLSILSSGFPFM